MSAASTAGVTRELVSGLGARLVVLPLAGLAAVGNARLVTEVLGAQPFAVYALVSGLPLLVPFADFGLGAALTNAASLAQEAPRSFMGTFRRTMIAATAIAGGSIAVICIVGALGGWPRLIGIDDASLNWPVAISLCLFFLTVPAGLGTSILLGLGRYTAAVIRQGLTPVVNFVVIALAVGLAPQLPVVIALSTSAGLLVNLWILAAALHTVRRMGIRGEDTVPVSFPILSTAVPMMMLMATGAIQLQSGRLVLSHASDLQAVGVYASLWLFFQPLFSVVQTAGRAVWPRFARARANVEDVRKVFIVATATSSCIGAGAGVALAVFGPIGAALATGGAYPVDYTQSSIMGAVLLVQGAFLPSGMFLTAPKGLAIQSVATACGAASTVLMGSMLAPDLGATGPMLALLLPLLSLQAVPISMIAWSTIRTRSGRSR